MEFPLISVIIITYGHENYIDNALQGALMQTGNFNMELLIADDCSPDKTEEVVRKTINNHPRGNLIKYFKHLNNMGVIPNFIWALKQAKGDFIAICEGDDYWTDPQKLKKQIEYLTFHSEVNLVGHYAKAIDTINNEEFITGRLPKDIYNFHEISMENIRIPTASLLFRNNIDWPSWMYEIYGGDRALIYLNSIKGKVKILNFTASVYRIHAGGIEQNFKTDKFKLPERNIREDLVYYKLAKNFRIKLKLFKKILWNLSYYFYWSFRLRDWRKCFVSVRSILSFIFLKR